MSINTNNENHNTTDRVAGKAHNAVDSAAETIAKAEEYARQHAAQADGALDGMSDYVRRNPLISLALAFISGLVFAFLKRQK